MKTRNSAPRESAQQLRTIDLFGGTRERNATTQKVRTRYLIEELRIDRANRDPLFTKPLEKSPCRS